MAVRAILYKTDNTRNWMARYTTDASGKAIEWGSSRSVVLPRSRENAALFKGCEVLVELAHSIGHVDLADEWTPVPNGRRDAREGPMTREKITAALWKDLRGATAVVFFDSFHARGKGSFNLVVAARTEALLREAYSSLDPLCGYSLPALQSLQKPGGINAVSASAPADFLNTFIGATALTSHRERNLVFVHLDNLAPPDGREVRPALARMYLDVALAHMPEVVEDPTPVVRAEPYVPGCLLEKRMGHAIASADPHGISTLVLYDPSAGGHHATQFEPYPEQLWRVITISKPQGARTASELEIGLRTGMGGISLNEDYNTIDGRAGALLARTYSTRQDFRAHVKAHPKTEDGTMLFIPVPGLVYKQQWGPSHSNVELDVVYRCVESAGEALQ